MGCGTVHYQSNKANEHRPVFKPYPDEINGINDKVSNAFYTFLKNHGAGTKPTNRDRPKLNFDLKDTKNFMKMNPSTAENKISKFELKNDENEEVDDAFFDKIQSKSSIDSLSAKSSENEQSLFVSIPYDLRNQSNRRKSSQYIVNISVNIDSEIKELEEEAEKIKSKYD